MRWSNNLGDISFFVWVLCSSHLLVQIMLAFAPVCAVPVTGARHRATSRRPTVSASLVSPAAAARERLLELIRPSSKGGDVGKALQELMNVAPEPGVAPGWESVMSGRWGLRHTTEPPLARLLELGETKSYQLFRVGDVVEVRVCETLM